MPFFHRLLCSLLTFALILCSLPFDPAAESPTPSLSAHSAILMDATHGQILYAKNATERRPMASTTKIMTALTALECASPQDTVTVPAEAVGVEGSSVYLTEGEQLTLEQLLYALLLESANDAAVAIAVSVGGSVEGFAELMNRKAAELGLKQTHFENPHGLDSPEHYTTAQDLATLTCHALRHPLFLQMVSTKKATIPHDGIPDTRLLVNHNKLLQRYEGAIGVKTGYTHKSGRCLVSAAERNGVRLVAVTLNAADDWNDHTAMLNYGFSLWQSVTLCETNGLCIPHPVVGGEQSQVIVSNPAMLSVALPKDYPTVTTVIELPRFFYAPVTDGETVGQAVFLCDLNRDGKPEVIGSTPLCVQCGTSRAKKNSKSLWQRFLSLFKK